MNQCINTVSPEHLKDGEGGKYRKSSRFQLMPKHTDTRKRTKTAIPHSNTTSSVPMPSNAPSRAAHTHINAHVQSSQMKALIILRL